MKISPYYRTEKERLELISRRDAFKFSVPEASPKLVLLISGREGSGKTHLACTMAELGPVYLIDTEYRAQIVTQKFKGVQFATCKSYIDIVIAIQHILKYQASGTIVLDSGSDLQRFAEIEYLERTQKDRVGMPWNWAEVWRLCNAVIDDIRFSEKFNLVITARLREEYVKEQPTGQLIPRIYSVLPYKADIMLQYSTDKERKLVVTKNGFTGESSTQPVQSKNLPGVIQQLQEVTKPPVHVAPKLTAIAKGA